MDVVADLKKSKCSWTPDLGIAARILPSEVWIHLMDLDQD